MSPAAKIQRAVVPKDLVPAAIVVDLNATYEGTVGLNDIQELRLGRDIEHSIADSQLQTVTGVVAQFESPEDVAGETDVLNDRRGRRLGDLGTRHVQTVLVEHDACQAP